MTRAAPRLLETAHFRVLGDVVEPRAGLRVDNDLVDAIVAELVPLGVVPDEAAFQRVFVDVVEAAAPTPALAWAAFHRNSIQLLRRPRGGSSSTAVFSRVYDRVDRLVRGSSVLDVGSCFGFLPALLVQRAPHRTVVGSDLKESAARLASGVVGRAVPYLCADACRLPLAARGVDTVTLVHVLEHLPADRAEAALAEACRVARRRVVVAVPYEELPQPAFGHVTCFTPQRLAALGRRSGLAFRVADADGGWLVLDHP